MSSGMAPFTSPVSLINNSSTVGGQYSEWFGDNCRLRLHFDSPNQYPEIRFENCSPLCVCCNEIYTGLLFVQWAIVWGSNQPSPLIGHSLACQVVSGTPPPPAMS